MTKHEHETLQAIDALIRGDFDIFWSKVKDIPHEDDAPLWSQVAAAHPKKLDLFDALLTLGQGDRAERAFRYLLPPISKLETSSASDIRKLLEFAGRLGSSFQWSIALRAEPLMRRHPELGAEVGSSLGNENVATQALSVWAISFAKGAPARAARYAIELLESSNRTLTQLAALVNSLRDASSEVSDVLLAHEARLVDVFANGEQRLGRLAWAVLEAMSAYSRLATKRLMEEVRARNPMAVSVLSVALFSQTEPTLGAAEVPMSEVVRTLFEGAIAEPNLRPSVDEAFTSLFRHSTMRPLVLAEFTRLVHFDVDVHQGFNDMTAELLRRPADFATLITTWLLAEDFQPRPLATILSPIPVSHTNLSLNSELFLAASEEAQAKALRRLLLAVHSGELLLAYAKDLIESTALQPKGNHFGAQLLSIARAEYPGTTRAFVTARLSELKGWSAPTRLYRQFADLMTQWDNHLASLPKLKELLPTAAESLALRAVRMRRSQQISRIAERGSLFAQLFTRSNIAQGGSFAVDIGSGQTTVTALQEVSVSIELPSSLGADPVGAALRRNEMFKVSR